jgi:hypothetical protein
MWRSIACAPDVAVVGDHRTESAGPAEPGRDLAELLGGVIARSREHDNESEPDDVGTRGVAQNEGLRRTAEQVEN